MFIFYLTQYTLNIIILTCSQYKNYELYDLHKWLY